MNNKIIKIIAIVVIALFVVSVTKDLIIKVGVEHGTQLITGLKLRMSGFSFGIIRGIVDIKNMRILNPKGYKDPNMVDMPEIYVDCDVPAIIGGKIHLTKVRIDMKEFTVVKNEKGELNLNSLKVVQAEKKEGKKSTEAKGGEAKMPPLQIDSLRLKIGKVVYKDYSAGGAPVVKEFNINLDEEYSNIDNPYSLVSLILVKVMMNTTIGSMANFDVSGLKGNISDTLSSATKMAGQAQEAATKATKTVTEATKSVKETADAVQKAFSNPFGN
jgi:flagellar hook-basal body complex protein FliE